MTASSKHTGWYENPDTGELQALFAGTERVAIDGTGIGFFQGAPVAQQSAPTAADGSTVDATYGTEERDVIQNLVTRQAEIITALQNLGLMAT